MKKISFSLIFLGIFFFSDGNFAQAEISVPKKVFAFSKVSGISIFWQQLKLKETEGVVLLRKKGTCPKSILDGEKIYQGDGSGYLDKEVTGGEDYCYGMYVANLSGEKSNLLNTAVVKKLNWQRYFLQVIRKNSLIIGGLVVAILILLDLIKKRKNCNVKK